MVGISEIDVDAIIAYGVIHLEGTYDNFTYPLKEEMQQWLLDRNIGYDFKKKKSTIKSLRLEKLKLVYKYSILLNNYGDISLINPNEISDFDLFNFSFPCTDVSVAGKQKGMKDEQGNLTRSGLYTYGINIIRTKKPKYIMIENVKNLIGKKFINDFYDIVNELNDIGYNCYYPKNNKDKPMCLNAKDYGVPQNRERIFVICIRKDIDNKQFQFPNGFDNGIRLKDLLEDKVDEKYYISQDKTDKLIEQLKVHSIGVNPCLTPDRMNRRQEGRRFKEDNDPSFTVTAQDKHGVLIKEDKQITGVYNQNDGFIEKEYGCTLDASYYKGLGNNQNRNAVLESNSINVVGQISNDGSQAGKVYNMEGVFPTICACTHGYAIGNILEDNKINIIGNLDIKGQDNIKRVYDINGVSPTLTNMQGGNRQPKILESNDLQFIGGIGEKDWVGDDKQYSRNYPQGNRVYDSEGIACSQTAQGGGIGSYSGLYKVEENINQEKSPVPELVGGIGEINFGKQYRQGNRVYSSEKTAMCLMSQPVGNTGGFSYLYNVDYRIRKLTPKECWRLMNFDDEDIDKCINIGISNTQLYKMSGNSIVVNVLYYIFKNLFNV